MEQRRKTAVFDSIVLMITAIFLVLIWLICFRHFKSITHDMHENSITGVIQMFGYTVFQMPFHGICVIIILLSLRFKKTGLVTAVTISLLILISFFVLLLPTAHSLDIFGLYLLQASLLPVIAGFLSVSVFNRIHNKNLTVIATVGIILAITLLLSSLSFDTLKIGSAMLSCLFAFVPFLLEKGVKDILSSVIEYRR